MKNFKLSIFSVLLLGFTLVIISCTPEEECETETVCYGNGNCIEKPIEK